MWAKVRGQEPFALRFRDGLRAATSVTGVRLRGVVSMNPDTSRWEARAAGLGQHPFKCASVRVKKKR